MLFNYKTNEGGLNIVKIVFHSFLGLIALILFFGCFSIVGAGERGVVLSFGAFNGQIMQPGLNFKVPIYQSVVKMNVRTTAFENEKSEAYSHDLQVVDIHSLVNYNLDPTAVGEIYKKYGLNFENTIIVARLEASVKQTVAKYTAEELLAKRGEVQNEIEQAVKGSLPVEFIVTKYSLVNEAFSQQFETAIENKQVALQKAEQAKNELTKAQVDAQARVATAEGEAKAIAIQAQAIQNQGGKEYVNLKWVEAWKEGGAKVPNTIIGNGSEKFILNLPNDK